MAKKRKKRVGTGGRPKALGRLAAAGPVLMAPPLEDAGRRFTFALAGKGAGTGQAVTVVEVWFCYPQGLFRLQSSPSERGAYELWAMEMCRRMQPDHPLLPERVRVPRAMFRQLAARIAAAVRDGRVGAEVDPDLAARFRSGGSAPEPKHPALGLALQDAALLTPEQFCEDRQRIRPFRQWASERFLWEASVDRAIIRGGAADNLARSIREWAADFGFEALEELLLDLASYSAATGDADGARTLRDVTSTATDRHEAIIDLVTSWARSDFSQRAVYVAPV